VFTELAPFLSTTKPSAYSAEVLAFNMAEPANSVTDLTTSMDVDPHLEWQVSLWDFLLALWLG